MSENTKTVTVEDKDLTEVRKEAFKAAFLQNDAVVEWQGEYNTIVTMDQSYPEENSEEITVSFQLLKVD